jgi:hypothetical protein
MGAQGEEDEPYQKVPALRLPRRAPIVEGERDKSSFPLANASARLPLSLVQPPLLRVLNWPPSTGNIKEVATLDSGLSVSRRFQINFLTTHSAVLALKL